MACPLHAHPLVPFPDFESFPAYLRLYRRRGARGVFFQGATPPGGGGSDAELRAWVVARLLWNPDADADALVTEWMKGVYGAAWEPMREWFDRLHAAASGPKARLVIDVNALDPMFTDELLATGDALFDRAERLAKTLATRDAVAKARLSLRFVKLDRGKRPGADLDGFVATARRLGLTHTADCETLEDWAAEVRGRGK
jgi:hypothetical protein